MSSNVNRTRCSSCNYEFEDGSHHKYLCPSCRWDLKKTVRQGKAKKMEHMKVMDEYGRQNNIPVKCMSDKIYLYYRYGVSKLDVTHEDHRKNILEQCDRLYYGRVRGEMKYTNKTPSSIASAIIYIAVVMAGINHISQADVAEVLNVTVSSVRSNYLYMRKMEGL